jgi:hypothetical protein
LCQEILDWHEQEIGGMAGKAQIPRDIEKSIKTLSYGINIM